MAAMAGVRVYSYDVTIYLYIIGFFSLFVNLGGVKIRTKKDKKICRESNGEYV